MWSSLPPEVLSRLLPRTADESANSNAHSQTREDWDRLIAELDGFRTLADNCDGQGFKAATATMIDSAVELVRGLHRSGVIPPTCVVPGVNGSVSLEWDLEHGVSAGIEVEGPDSAEVYVITPGWDRAESWPLTRAEAAGGGGAALGTPKSMRTAS